MWIYIYICIYGSNLFITQENVLTIYHQYFVTGCCIRFATACFMVEESDLYIYCGYLRNCDLRMNPVDRRINKITNKITTKFG